MRVLVPTAGLPPAKKSAEYIARIAKGLQADIVVLHVYEGTHPAPGAREAFDIFVEAADELGLKVQSRIQRGAVVDTIRSVAEGGDFSLIIMGASDGIVVEEWVSSKVLNSSQLPVVVIPNLSRGKEN